MAQFDSELPLNNQWSEKPEKESDFAMSPEKKINSTLLYNENNKKIFSPKIVFSALMLIALGTLAYGFFSLSKNIYQSNDLAVQQSTEIPAADSLIDEIAKQKQLDTDKDTLNDYEEINVYETSPYLADTDSDGYDDKTEIMRGHDPLCPKEDNCRIEWAGKSGVSTSTPTNTNEPLIAEPSESNLTETADAAEAETLTAEQLQALNSLTAAEVRELLIAEGGVSEEELSAIDDETLMQIYKEALTSEQQ